VTKIHCADVSQISYHPECTSITAAASGVPDNACAESDGRLLSSRGVWKHLEVRSSTGEVAWSVWENFVLLPDQFTLC